MIIQGEWLGSCLSWVIFGTAYSPLSNMKGQSYISLAPPNILAKQMLHIHTMNIFQY